MVPSLAVKAAAASIILQVLAFAATAARLASRKKGKIRLGVDDYALLLSLAGAIAITTLLVYDALNGMLYVAPTAMDRESHEKFRTYRKHQFVVVRGSYVFLGIIKISILLFYKRIFTTTKFLLAANIAIAITATVTTLIFVLLIISVKPVSDYWASPVGVIPDQLIPTNNLIFACSLISVTLDLLVLLLPFPVIRRLHMTRQKKAYTFGIFLLGTLCLIGSILRLYYTQYYAALRRRKENRDDQRPSDQLSNIALWFQIELCISIIVACLMTLGALFKKKSLESTIRNAQVFQSIASYSSTNDQEKVDNSKAVPQLRAPREWFEAHLDEAAVSINITADNALVLPPQNSDERIIVRESITTEESLR